MISNLFNPEPTNTISGDELEFMATLGHIGNFDPAEESISVYLERMELFFAANGIKDEKQVAVLLSVIGPKIYALLRDLLAPEKPQDKSVATLSETLRKHFEPKPVIIAERFRFHRRDQASGESIVEYLAELRRLAAHCQFGEYLDEALRDRFVCGLRNSGTQKRLLTETEPLTLKKALEVAVAVEAADLKAKELQSSESAQLRKVEQIPPTRKNKKPCYRCGKQDHSPSDCKYRDFVCRKCSKKGHLAKVCRSRSQSDDKPADARNSTNKKTNWVNTGESTIETLKGDETIFCVKETNNRSLHVELELNNSQVPFEVDTGAAVTIMSHHSFKQYLPQVHLDNTEVTLQTYTAEPMKVLGEATVQVKYGDYCGTLKVYVVNGTGPNLMGLNWLQHIRLDWKSLGVAVVKNKPQYLPEILEHYQEVFQDELGNMKDFTAKLEIKSNAKPKFCRPRSIPFAIKELVEQELKSLQSKGILEQVKCSEWATPLVPVPQPDGKIRLCGDYKTTVNPVLDVDQYPLPKPEELMATISGGQKFTKLDLSAAYQQMLLDEESRKLVTVNTHLGLFRYCRLPFGIASAPAIFQHAMDTLLKGIPHVICYIDDLLVTGLTEEEHLQNLTQVLCRLQEQGMRLKREKCSFLQNAVEYLGYQIDANGVHTAPSKLQAIQRAPAPENVNQLRAFLGLLNYYGKFIPNLSTMIHPLNALLRHGVRWKWTQECAAAFTQAKESLSAESVLAHYNPQLPL